MFVNGAAFKQAIPELAEGLMTASRHAVSGNADELMRSATNVRSAAAKLGAVHAPAALQNVDNGSIIQQLSTRVGYGIDMLGARIAGGPEGALAGTVKVSTYGQMLARELGAG